MMSRPKILKRLIGVGTGVATEASPPPSHFKGLSDSATYAHGTQAVQPDLIKGLLWEQNLWITHVAFYVLSQQVIPPPIIISMVQNCRLTHPYSSLSLTLFCQLGVQAFQNQISMPETIQPDEVLSDSHCVLRSYRGHKRERDVYERLSSVSPIHNASLCLHCVLVRSMWLVTMEGSVCRRKWLGWLTIWWVITRTFPLIVCFVESTTGTLHSLTHKLLYLSISLSSFCKY